MGFLGNLFDKIYEVNSPAFFGLGAVISFAGLAFAILYRVYLAKTVALVLEAKKVESVKTWKVLTFIFGLLVAIICFAINFKVGEKIDNDKVKKLIKKYIINTIVFGLLLLAMRPVEMTYLQKQFDYSKKALIECYHPSFYDDELETYVCYDKLGNTYTINDEYDKIFFYDKDGNKYKENEDWNYYCADTSKVVKRGNGFIDENGYFVIKYNLEKYLSEDDDEWDDYTLFSYDEDKNIYFYPGDCSWDKDGNLILVEDVQNFDFNSFKK